MRDDFTNKTKEILAKRVNYCCSNPECRIYTSGPHSDSEKASTIGVASHITAAEVGGPRYDSTLTSEERKPVNNGIWLCENCGKMIDKDPINYSVIKLFRWKLEAEQRAFSNKGNTPIEGENHSQISKKEMYKNINKLISEVDLRYSYYKNYYDYNFSHTENFVEVDNCIDKYYGIHREMVERINKLSEVQNKLESYIIEHELDIENSVFNMLNEYVKLSYFTYQSDGDVGLYNNYLEKFYENVVLNHDIRKTLLNDIKNGIRNVY